VLNDNWWLSEVETRILKRLLEDREAELAARRAAAS
jgi:hypothetical protein